MKKQRTLLLAALLMLSGTMYAKIVLPPMFSDNMVLQQQTDAPVWGQAKSGATVKVTTSWNGKTYQTQADKEGKWKLSVSTPQAGGPYEMILTDGSKLTLKNVMIGEVWICSGQSNMEMPLEGWGKIMDYQQEIAAANHPNIRLLHAEHVTSSKPENNIVIRDNGWQICSPTTIADFSATAYFFGREIAEKQNVPIGLIHTSWGGTIAEAWTSGKVLNEMPSFQKAIEEVQALPGNSDTPNKPTLLYNAMIHPLIPYSLQGAIWYQGESNAGRAHQYRELFPLLIENWRKDWGKNFPFYFVQLANFQKKNSEPVESDWAELREAQTRTLALANTGMAVIIDKGDANDIHPKDKQVVGHRLALIARARTYGENISYSGPLYRSHQVDGNKITLSFDHIDGGLKSGDGKSLQGFAIAGRDHKFHWAKAEITGDKVVVSSPEVPFPVAVRYGWANNPDCNLYNSADLPASPFRTDDWKGVTQK